MPKELKVGDKAPLFDLLNQDSTKVALDDFVGKWVVLYFYPKDSTSGCTIQACDFTSSIEDFDKLNGVILGVSPDSVESHQKFIVKSELSITLLSDEEKTVLKLYNAWGKKQMYGKEYDGVKRSTFIINPKGDIAKIYQGVKAKGHSEIVLNDLEELKK